MNAYRGDSENWQRDESRRDRRVAVAGIIVNAIAVILSAAIGAVIGAFAAAHNPQIIKVLGGNPKTAATSSSTGGPQPPVGGLPQGPAFTRRSATINSNGLDLDRNPPENGGVTHGEIDVSQNGGPALSLLFDYSLEAVQWKQRGIPDQAQCHDDEITNGDPQLTFDLTGTQQSKATVSFCVLTSEGRDAYVVIHGSQLADNQPIPAQVFVWRRIIPVG
jgi:hypothetical protein